MNAVFPQIATSASPESTSYVASRRLFLFLLSAGAATLMFWAPVRDVLHYSADSESSYIPLVPVIVVFLLAFRRQKILDTVVPRPAAGAVVATAAVGLLIVRRYLPLETSGRLTLEMSSLVGVWVGLFIAYFGWLTAKKAGIALVLLAFAIPWPAEAMNGIVAYLQHGSAVLSYYLFRAIGVPAVREGMRLSVPGITIEVAPQCSGIRSSISLLILTLVGANLYVRSFRSKVVLVAAVVPLMVLKNAVRIVTLSTLALYVDRGFLTGHLHHDGGIVFFLIALVILMYILVILQRIERKTPILRAKGTDVIRIPNNESIAGAQASEPTDCVAVTETTV